MGRLPTLKDAWLLWMKSDQRLWPDERLQHDAFFSLQGQQALRKWTQGQNGVSRFLRFAHPYCICGSREIEYIDKIRAYLMKKSPNAVGHIESAQRLQRAGEQELIEQAWNVWKRSKCWAQGLWRSKAARADHRKRAENAAGDPCLKDLSPLTIKATSWEHMLCCRI
jgi:hypothetical protein